MTIEAICKFHLLPKHWTGSDVHTSLKPKLIKAQSKPIYENIILNLPLCHYMFLKYFFTILIQVEHAHGFYFLKIFKIWYYKTQKNPPSLLALFSIHNNPTPKDNPLFSIWWILRTCIKSKTPPCKLKFFVFIKRF